MNGNNSKIWIGEFRSDKNNVKLISVFSFLKNSNSLKTFKINMEKIKRKHGKNK